MILTVDMIRDTFPDATRVIELKPGTRRHEWIEAKQHPVRDLTPEPIGATIDRHEVNLDACYRVNGVVVRGALYRATFYYAEDRSTP